MAKAEKLRITRLRQLKNMLEKHDKIFPKRLEFHMNSWFEGKLEKNKSIKDCGTAACALGSAACYTPFNKSGLTIIRHRDYEGKLTDSFEPKYKTHTGVSAGVRFFDISYDEANFLFMPEEYENGEEDQKLISPNRVANRVQVIIDNYS